MIQIYSTDRFRKSILFLVGLCVALSCALAIWVLSRGPHKGVPAKVRIGTASAGGAYGKIGNAFAPILKSELKDVKVEVKLTEGSMENLERLKRGEQELALIQSDVPGTKDVQIITPLYREYLHIVVDRECIPDAKTIYDLNGKRVAIGPAGSGTRALVKKVLNKYNVEVVENDAHSVTQEKERLLGITEKGEEIPNEKIDAICRVAGRPDVIIEEILRDRRMKLIPIDESTQDEESHMLEGFHKKYIGYETCELEMVYTNQGRKICTISVTALFVARADLDANFIYQVAYLFEDNRSTMMMKEDVAVYLDDKISPTDEKGNIIKGLYHFEYHPGALNYYTNNMLDSFIASHTNVSLISLVVLLLGLAILLAIREFLRIRSGASLRRHVVEYSTVETKTHDVFICYSTKSNEARIATERVCDTLESKGIKCWYAPRDIEAGQEWPESIPSAIKRTGTALILVFTSEANTSKHVARELTLASSCNLNIVPFRLENVLPEGAVEYHVADVQWINAFSDSLENRLEMLLNTIKSEQAIRGVAQETKKLSEKKEAMSEEEGIAPTAEVSHSRRVSWIVGFFIILALVTIGLWHPWKYFLIPSSVPHPKDPRDGAFVMEQLIYRWDFKGHAPGVRYEVRRSTMTGIPFTSRNIVGNSYQEKVLNGKIKWQVRALVPAQDGSLSPTKWSESRIVEFYGDTLQKIKMRAEVVVAIGDEVIIRSPDDPEIFLIRSALEDYLDRVAPETHLKIIMYNVAFYELETLFKRNDADKYDLMAARLSVRDERRTYWKVDFTTPLTRYPQAFVYLEYRPLCIREGYSGICRIGVIKGTVNEKLANRLLEEKVQGEVIMFEEKDYVYCAMYQALRRGNVDLLVMDFPFAQQLQMESRRFKPHLIVTTTEEVFKEDPPPLEEIAIAVKDFDTQLLEVLNQGVERYKSDIQKKFDKFVMSPLLIEDCF